MHTLFIPDQLIINLQRNRNELSTLFLNELDKKKPASVFFLPVYKFISLYKLQVNQYGVHKTVMKKKTRNRNHLHLVFLMQNYYRLYSTCWYTLWNNYRIGLRLVGSGFFFGLETIGSQQVITIYAGTSHLHVVVLDTNSCMRAFLAGRKKKILFITSFSVLKLQHLSHRIKNLRYPDPYKGKGLRHLYERFRLKTGKKKFV